MRKILRERFAFVLIASLLTATVGVAASAESLAPDDKSKRFIHKDQAAIKMGKKAKGQGTDFAFRGNLIIAGAYEGVGFFKRNRGGAGIKQVGFYDCPGSQSDVSVWHNLLFISVDSPTSNIGKTPLCNNTKTNMSKSSHEKEGVRIVDISNINQPRQVGFIETVCGSHTHTLVPDNGDLYMYVNSYPISGQGASCNQAAHRKFAIVKVDKSNPVNSKIANTHTTPPDTVGCHDTTIYPNKDLGIAACLGVWLTLDISNPAKPKTLAEVRNPEIELDHSSAITWDGKIAIIGDEHAGAAGGGGCSPDSQSPVGAMWFYDITDPSAPVLKSHHSLPRVPSIDSQTDSDRFRCTTHNFNVVPMKKKGKYIVVSSYYAGGIAAINFSDPENPREIAHYVNERNDVNPDTWAAYWYNGYVYTNDHSSKFGVGVYRLKRTGRWAAHYFEGGMNPQLQIKRFK